MSKMTKEERARVLVKAWLACPDTFAEFALGIVREQDAREGPLVEAMRDADRLISTPSWPAALAGVRRALAAYDALDAKPEPTVAQAFALAEASRFVDDDEPDVHIRKSAWDALKAAVEREEGKR